jgi:hypothetical protein
MPFKNTSDEDVEYLVEEESFMVRRTLNVEVKEDDLKQQRDNIFHTRCHVNNKLCSMIIHGGSCANITSFMLIRKLNLNIKKHYIPYKF